MVIRLHFAKHGHHTDHIIAARNTDGVIEPSSHAAAPKMEVLGELEDRAATFPRALQSTRDLNTAQHSHTTSNGKHSNSVKLITPDILNHSPKIYQIRTKRKHLFIIDTASEPRSAHQFA
jgi:hypothetical protein